jgi:hypothetical protein
MAAKEHQRIGIAELTITICVGKIEWLRYTSVV